MAGGTASREGPRRRALPLLPVLLAAFVASAALAGPVFASDWRRSVTFPAEGPGGAVVSTLLDWTAGPTGVCGASNLYAVHIQDHTGGTVGSGWDYGSPHGVGMCRWFTGDFVPPALGGFDPDTIYNVTIVWAGDHDSTLSVTATTGGYFGSAQTTSGLAQGGQTSCTGTADGGSYSGSSGCESTLFFTFQTYGVGVSPAVTGMEIAGGSTTAVHSILIEGTGRSGGDCVGVGALHEGAANLTGVWGDDWDATWAGCLANADHVVTYTPPDFVGGHVFQFRESWSAIGAGGTGRIRMEWVGGGAAAFFEKSTTTTGGGVLYSFAATAPAGATGVRWRISAGTEQFQHDVADVNEAGPGSDAGQSSDAAYEVCYAPSSVLNLGALAGYLGCELRNAATAIVNGITGAISAAIQYLFVPRTLGAQWAAFRTMVGGKVPFGWFGQVSAAISDGLSGSAPSLGSWTFTLGGTSVAAGTALTTATSAVAPFRGIIFGGVVLSLTLGCLHWIMAAVGVSRSGGGDE